jgi:hypothetical protein
MKDSRGLITALVSSPAAAKIMSKAGMKWAVIFM